VTALEKFVYPALEEIDDELDPGITLERAPDTVLFGPNGALDSLALVSLLVALEERIEDETGQAVRLVNDDAMSRRKSPFRTLGALAAYVDELLGPNGR
jgi:acyl carrier protein